MNDRLRIACSERLERLNLPHRFGTQQLCDAVAELRGKPIVLRPMDTATTGDLPCGIRVETATADILYFERGTSALHQMHILAHEIGHVLCDHPGSLSLGGDADQALGLNPTLVQRMSGRTSYRNDDEREAEMMATVIRQRIYRGRELPPAQPYDRTERWEALFASSSQKKRKSL
ncbi:regulator component [Streptomyces sp. NPDC049555]|uniref:regulator component n=1 Tax=Streptomyces sp. NPDC049555 TaxID=3154930 RepID=UPI0034138A8F